MRRAEHFFFFIRVQIFRLRTNRIRASSSVEIGAERRRLWLTALVTHLLAASKGAPPNHGTQNYDCGTGQPRFLWRSVPIERYQSDFRARP